MVNEALNEMARRVCAECDVELVYAHEMPGGYMVRVSCELGWRSFAMFQFNAQTGENVPLVVDEALEHELRTWVADWSEPAAIFPHGHPGFTFFSP